jgi:hypothetical protein
MDGPWNVQKAELDLSEDEEYEEAAKRGGQVAEASGTWGARFFEARFLIAALSKRLHSQEPGCNQFSERTEALCRDEPAVGNNELSLEKLLVQGDSGSPIWMVKFSLPSFKDDFLFEVDFVGRHVQVTENGAGWRTMHGNGYQFWSGKIESRLVWEKKERWV